MFEITMPVIIFRDEEEIGSGQLLPNGASLSLCPDNNIELLPLEADSEAVEERIPLTFFKDGKKVATGELFHSGEYICLCPEDISLDFLNPENVAELRVEKLGHSATLKIRSAA